jgi:hypothetical protein
VRQTEEIEMKKRVVWSLLSGLLVLVLASGCAMGARESASDSDSGSAPPPMAAEPEEPREEMKGEGSYQSVADVPQSARMIIYTGELSLVVSNTDEAQATVVALAEEMGGYIASASSYTYAGDLRRITISLRVPADRFNATMDTLRGLALEVTQDSIGSQDVTQEYVDLTSRLNALEVKAARLEELMEEAEDTEAVLAVYAELSETQIRIEETKGRMQYLERHAAMATINVYLTPDAMSQPVEIAGWRPGGTARRAIESLVATFQFLFDAAIWLVLAVAPVLAFIGLILYAFVRVVIWLSRRMKAPARES